MYLLGIGLIMLALKYLEIAPVAEWSWLIVLSPLGLAILWWAWADASGYTRRKAVEREDKRREDRIERSRQAIGRGKRPSGRR